MRVSGSDELPKIKNDAYQTDLEKKQQHNIKKAENQIKTG